MDRITLGALVLISIFLCELTFAQEWVRPGAGRSEYVQDRSACVKEAQSMALAGEVFDKDVTTCLVSKGWQRNLSDNNTPVYCARREAATSCKAGGTEEMYMKDRAECYDRTMKSVGNKYSRPGWWGLGGLIVSTIETEQNKTNLQKAQLQSMKICLEGKNWTVELKGETRAMTYVERNDPPAPRATPTQTPPPLPATASAVNAPREPYCTGSYNATTWTNCVGTLTSPDGRKYVGEFRDGRIYGQGTLTLSDGQKYVGGFRDGRRSGQGTLYGPNDAILQAGMWENDVFVGGQ